MEQKRKLMMTAVICAVADLIIITLIILIFGTYRNRKNAETPLSAESAAVEEAAAGEETGSGSAEAAADDSTGPLTKEQIKRLLEDATEAYVGWVVGWGATLDRESDTLTVGNRKYCRVTDGKCRSIDEINTTLHAIYTNACCADYPIDSLYMEQDGKLYGYEMLGQGGDAPPGNVSLKILSQTETECRVCVQYSEEHASDLNCTLVKEDGKWKFTEPINVYTGFPYLEDTVPWVD